MDKEKIKVDKLIISEILKKRITTEPTDTQKNNMRKSALSLYNIQTKTRKKKNHNNKPIFL